MHTPFLLLAALLSLTTTSAQACPRNESQLICPGDRVVAENREKMKSWPGVVIAVNNAMKKISIRHDDGDVATWNLDRVAIGSGCIQGYCVGDRAIGENVEKGRSWDGEIVAVNPYSQRIAILHTDGETETWSIDRVSIGVGCLRGYCVGDGAVATNFETGNSYEGEIIGVNPVSGRIAILHTDYDVATWRFDRVGSSNVCSDYGSMERSLPRFPALHPGQYSIPRLKYRHRR